MTLWRCALNRQPISCSADNLLLAATSSTASSAGLRMPHLHCHTRAWHLRACHRCTTTTTNGAPRHRCRHPGGRSPTSLPPHGGTRGRRNHSGQYKHAAICFMRTPRTSRRPTPVPPLARRSRLLSRSIFTPFTYAPSASSLRAWRCRTLPGNNILRSKTKQPAAQNALDFCDARLPPHYLPSYAAHHQQLTRFAWHRALLLRLPGSDCVREEGLVAAHACTTVTH